MGREKLTGLLRILCALMLVFALGVAFTACGGDDDEAETKTVTEEAEEKDEEHADTQAEAPGTTTEPTQEDEGIHQAPPDAPPASPEREEFEDELHVEFVDLGITSTQADCIINDLRENVTDPELEEGIAKIDRGEEWDALNDAVERCS